MKKNIFPSVKEALPVAVVTVLFLLLTAVCIGLRTEHLLMAGLFLVLFFAGKTIHVSNQSIVSTAQLRSKSCRKGERGSSGEL